MFLGGSLWSKTSKGIPELVPRRILELVGDFCRAKDSRFDLGRTGLTGRSPDSPAIGSDTPGLWWSRHSGFRPGNSGLGSPDTPSRCPDIPDFWS